MGGGGFLPYVYTTAPGHLFTRTGYVVVALAPSVILIALTAALVGWTPSGGWMVVPAAFHLAGCVGDWWLVGLAGHQPAGLAGFHSSHIDSPQSRPTTMRIMEL